MHTHTPFSRHWLRKPFLGMATLLAIFLTVSARPLQDVADDVSLARKALEEMVETQRLIAVARNGWKVDRELLQDRAQLLAGELEALRASIGEASADAEEARAAEEELAKEEAELAQASAGLAAMVGALESSTSGLLQQLPSSLQATLRPLSQALPDDPESTQESLTERFPRLLGILNQVNKFNRVIHALLERVELPDGTSVEVTALYLGLGQAFYATPDGVRAGVGTPSGSGWTWSEANASAQEIAAAIAIYRKATAAAFARVPVVVQ